MSDFNIDLKKFAENAKKMRKAKEDFSKCFDAEAHELEKSIKILFGENEQTYIYGELVKVGINVISFPKVGRLQTIFNYIEQAFLKKYQEHFLSTYNTKELPEQPKKPEVGSDKNVITEFNTLIKKWQDESKVIKEWNTKFNTVKEYLESIITVDLYGDTSIDVTNLPYVYFNFLNTDIDEIEVFMQELKTCPAAPVKKIITIRIEDISAKLPDFLKSANEVRVYFNTEDEAAELHGSKDYVEGVYEKYVIKNDTMKKSGGEWGMYNQRKDNLSNPVIGGFSLHSVPTPVNLNSGNSVDEEEEFYKKDYEVDISDCYYGITTFNDEDVFAIVPKAFWKEYGTVLVNPTMKILGITDTKSWKREDIFFKSYDTTENAEEYLSDASEYSESITNYLTEQANLSPFKKALQKLVNTTKFEDGWEWNGDAEIYNLSEVKNFPTSQDLYDKLSLSDKKTLWNFQGLKTEAEFLNENDLDEEQDFENCDVESLDDESLTIRCGGDWQQPAIIRFELVGNDIEVVDYYYDVDGNNSNYSDEEEEAEEVDEIEDSFIEDETIVFAPEECYWVIDYMDDDGDFYLSITPKSYWKTNNAIYENDLNFETNVSNYKLTGSFDDGYVLYDKNGNPVKTLLLIAKIMKEAGFEFSNEIQKEFVSDSLNGKRVRYTENSDVEFFNNATVEFAEYLYNLDSEEKVEVNVKTSVLDVVQNNKNEHKIIELLSKFINKNNIEEKDIEGKTALVLASENNYINLVKFLIEKGANVNSKDKDNGVPLFWAAYKGNVEIVKLLLNNGADINAQDNKGNTALIFAAMYNQYNVVEELISKGANLNLRNNHFHTALDCANVCKFNKISNLLLNAVLLNGDNDEEDDDSDDEDYEYNNANDFVWAININPDLGSSILFNDGSGNNDLAMLIITPKKYWNKYKCVSDVGGEGAERFIMKGYELDEEMESTFTIRYGNSSNYVNKISEIKLVLDKSGFEYSWDMQKFLDNSYSIVDSNNYANEKDFFAALKVKLGQ